MTKIAFGCDLIYDVASTTTFLFHLGVAHIECQEILREQLHVWPNVSVEALDVGIERNRAHRLTVEPGQLVLNYQGVVRLTAESDPADGLVETPYRHLPADALPYLNPSRYCESDLLANYALSEFGFKKQGYARVKAICHWTHRQLKYTSGSTDARTTARDVLVQRQGVCRDFAHLAISLCRGLSIPARYASGYAVNLQPPDFHGFFEAYLGDRWYLFDATGLAQVGGLVKIGVGRDAADIPFATLMGSAVLQSKVVWARVIDSQPKPHPVNGAEAVSTF